MSHPPGFEATPNDSAPPPSSSAAANDDGNNPRPVKQPQRARNTRCGGENGPSPSPSQLQRQNRPNRNNNNDSNRPAQGNRVNQNNRVNRNNREDREARPNHRFNNDHRNRNNTKRGQHQERGENGDYGARKSYAHKRFLKEVFQVRKDHAGVPITGPTIQCLICCQPSDLFGLGDCLHPICMECMIRSRILGKSELCSQCRNKIETVYFVSTSSRGKESEFRIPADDQSILDPKYADLRFENEHVLKCFKSYLAHKCRICLNRHDDCEFSSFGALQQHMAQAHQVSFCFLCNENLNALSKDRATYSRKQLNHHFSGDLKLETGFEGHPKCNFCAERFFDKDQEYRHLRKDHYYCQICDEDGVMEHVFYKQYAELSRHYKKKHHPCLESGCNFIVYRTPMELDIHRAKEHNMGGGRNRVLLDFQINRPSAAPNRREGGGPGPSGYHQRRRFNSSNNNNAQSVEEDAAALAAGLATSMSENQPSVVIVPSAQSRTTRIISSTARFDSNSSAEFPNLFLQSQASVRQAQPFVEQFPSLAGTSDVPSLSSSTAASIWSKTTPRELFRNRPQPPQPKPPIGYNPVDGGTAKRYFKLQPSSEFVALVDQANAEAAEPPLSAPPEKQKTRKKKTKMLSQAEGAKLSSEKYADYVPTSSSRYNALLDEDDEPGNSGTSAKIGGPVRDWWSGGTGSASSRTNTVLRPSTDDFMRIELASGGSGVVSARGAAKTKGDDASSKQDTIAEPPKPTLSLRSIAAMLLSANETNTDGGEVDNAKKNVADEKTVDDVEKRERNSVQSSTEIVDGGVNDGDDQLGRSGGGTVAKKVFSLLPEGYVDDDGDGGGTEAVDTAVDAVITVKEESPPLAGLDSPSGLTSPSQSLSDPVRPKQETERCAPPPGFSASGGAASPPPGFESFARKKSAEYDV